MVREHHKNLSWISSLRSKTTSFKSLKETIEGLVPRLDGSTISKVEIDLNQWNNRQDQKYGRTIDLDMILASIPAASQVVLKSGDGVYQHANERYALVVQGTRCIGIAVTKSFAKYNEVIQMGNLIVSRGDKGSSRERKELGFDGNYRTQHIKKDRFDPSVSALMMSVSQCVQRYCTMGGDRIAIHTEGHIILDGITRYKQQDALLAIVKSIFGPASVRRTVRLPKMKGLEFDIWVPDLNLAIEFQGQQHDRPIELWGGEIAFEKQVERDQRKRELAIANGYTLVEFWYHETIDPASVRARLSAVLGRII